jgi:hypothetical protein
MKTLITVLRQRNNERVTVAALLTADQLRFEEYRAQAAECQEIANRWPDPIKYEYNTFARQWLALAEQAKSNW